MAEHTQAASVLLEAERSLRESYEKNLTIEKHRIELEREIEQRIQAEERALASVREKEVLLREVYHRVKNNLAVVSSLFYLQSSTTKDERTIRILQDSQDRVRSMALVHESLYRSDNLAAVDFGEYALELARSLLASHQMPDRAIRIVSDLDPVSLSIEQAVPCGLILNELFTNALKHAFPQSTTGEIVLSWKRGPDGESILRVIDNGVGLPEESILQATQSLGLRLIHSLARQIDAQFTFVRRESGTEACLQMKVSHDSDRT